MIIRSRIITSSLRTFQVTFHLFQYIYCVMSCSSDTWPTMPPLQVQLPEKLNGCLEEFRAFYNQKHNVRTFDWVRSQSKDKVADNCFKSTYHFEVSFDEVFQFEFLTVIERTFKHLQIIQLEARRQKTQLDSLSIEGRGRC